MNEQQNMSPTEASAEEIFNKALKKANDAYLLIVILCGAIALGGVFYAVIDSVFIGLLVSIAGVVLYTALTSNTLYNLLGISYRSATKKLTVTAFYGRGQEETFIPARLIWLDVSELGDNALKHKSSESIRVLHLPSTLKVIGENAFEGCTRLTTLVFGGTLEEFDKIESLSDLSAYEIICADGVIAPTLPKSPEEDIPAEGDSAEATDAEAADVAEGENK